MDLEHIEDHREMSMKLICVHSISRESEVIEMNETALMLRDAAYIAAIIARSATPISEEERQRGERIILRLLHRNNLSFIDVVRILFRELENAGITRNNKRSVDLMQARLYNLIRQSCGIADENNETIIEKGE